MYRGGLLCFRYNSELTRNILDRYRFKYNHIEQQLDGTTAPRCYFFCSTYKDKNVVTGEATPFLGKTEQELSLGEQKIKHTLLVADTENEGILGMDFLQAHKCDLVLTRKILKVNGEEIVLRTAEMRSHGAVE